MTLPMFGMWEDKKKRKHKDYQFMSLVLLITNAFWKKKTKNTNHFVLSIQIKKKKQTKHNFI